MNSYNKKRLIIGVTLIAVTAFITTYIIFKEFGFSDIISVMQNISSGWLVPATLCMLAFSVCEAINIGHGLKISGYRPNFSSLMKYAYTGFFFSSITPSASGGQPAQIYIMKKDGVSISHGSFSLLFELIGYEIASISIATLGLVTSIISGNVQILSGLTIVLVIGFSVNLLFLACLSLLVFSKKAVKPMACFVLRIVSLFSQRKETRQAILKTFAEYSIASEKLQKNKLAFIKVVLTSFIQFFCYHSITFFCYKALGLSDHSWFELMSMQGLLFTSVSCIPLPGSSGAMEGGFSILFKAIFPNAILGSAIILSRLVSFAFPLILSGLFLLFSFKKKQTSKRVS